MTPHTQRLPVALVPKHFELAAMWRDVIHHVRWPATRRAQRVLRKEDSARFAPPAPLV